MIVCRKPCTIYDVDVIGVAALVVIALAACFGVIVPARVNATEYRARAAQIAAANAQLEQTHGRLRKINAEITTLRSGVAEHMRAAPKPGAQTQFLQRVASLAKQCNLQIAQVWPQPTQMAKGYLLSDIRFSGRGTALDLARLLDQLARENPYQRLEDFAITHAADPEDPRCALSWTLRLYMLADDPLGQVAEKP